MTINYKVELLRAGRTIYILMREDDYKVSVKVDKANNLRIKYGSGPMWFVMNVGSMVD